MLPHWEEHLGILETELGSEHAPHRLFLLETEYLRDVTAAELRWVRGITEDLRENALSWSEKDLELARGSAELSAVNGRDRKTVGRPTNGRVLQRTTFGSHALGHEAAAPGNAAGVLHVRSRTPLAKGPR